MSKQTIIVDACTKEPRINDNKFAKHHKLGEYWGIKPQNKDVWINVYGLPGRPAKGQELNLEVGCDQWTPKGSQEVKLAWWADYVGNKAIPAVGNGWPAPEQAPKPPIPSLPEPQMPFSKPTGLIPWSEYERTLMAAHHIAVVVEPDSDVTGGVFDRAGARAAIVNTVMIAFTNGKIAAPITEPIAGQTPMDNGDWTAAVPPPAEDDIPW